MKKNYLVVLFAIVIVLLILLSLTEVIDEKIGMCVSLFLVIIFTIIMSFIAFKNDVPVVAWFMILCMCIGVVLFGLNIYSLFNNNNDEDNYKFVVTVKENKSEKKLLFTNNGTNYYTYNLSDVNVTMLDENKTYSLKDSINNGYITLDEILNMAIQDKNTVGYKIYYDGGLDKYKDDEYSIIICESSKDVIFSNFTYKFQEDICKN